MFPFILLAIFAGIIFAFLAVGAFASRHAASLRGVQPTRDTWLTPEAYLP